MGLSDIISAMLTAGAWTTCSRGALTQELQTRQLMHSRDHVQHGKGIVSVQNAHTAPEARSHHQANHTATHLQRVCAANLQVMFAYDHTDTQTPPLARPTQEKEQHALSSPHLQRVCVADLHAVEAEGHACL
jgi:hypothetical protein